MSIFLQGQGVELKISSGDKTKDANIFNCQGISINYQHSRSEITYLGNYSAEDKKQIINYTPINLAFSYLNSESKIIEENIGLLNPSGCFININKSNNINDYSSRDYKILMRPTNSQNYAGQINLYSGFLGQYTISASVGNPIASSVSFECLDMQSVPNSDTQSGISTNNLLSTESIVLTGINFSGLGVSGLKINSLSLNLSTQWNNILKIGQKFPEKTLIGTNGVIQINGILNTIQDSQKLSEIDNGTFYSGDISLKLRSKCSENDVLSILIKKPYIESRNINITPGNYSAVSIEMNVKPTIKPSEWNKSNIIFS